MVLILYFTPQDNLRVKKLIILDKEYKNSVHSLFKRGDPYCVGFNIFFLLFLFFFFLYLNPALGSFCVQDPVSPKKQKNSYPHYAPL